MNFVCFMTINIGGGLAVTPKGQENSSGQLNNRFKYISHFSTELATFAHTGPTCVQIEEKFNQAAVQFKEPDRKNLRNGGVRDHTKHKKNLFRCLKMALSDEITG